MHGSAEPERRGEPCPVALAGAVLSEPGNGVGRECGNGEKKRSPACGNEQSGDRVFGSTAKKSSIFAELAGGRFFDFDFEGFVGNAVAGDGESCLAGGIAFGAEDDLSHS